MNAECRELRRYWEEHAHDALEPGLAHRVATHLEGCAECGAAQAEIAALVRRLRMLAPVDPPECLWERARERLGREVEGRSPRVRALRLAALAAAASLIAILSVHFLGGDAPRLPDGTLRPLEFEGKGRSGAIRGAPQESTSVELRLQVGARPAAGQEFDVLRAGRIVGHGRVVEALSEARVIGVADPVPGEALRAGDAVQLRK